MLPVGLFWSFKSEAILTWGCFNWIINLIWSLTHSDHSVNHLPFVTSLCGPCCCLIWPLFLTTRRLWISPDMDPNQSGWPIVQISLYSIALYWEVRNWFADVIVGHERFLTLEHSRLCWKSAWFYTVSPRFFGLQFIGRSILWSISRVRTIV